MKCPPDARSLPWLHSSGTCRVIAAVLLTATVGLASRAMGQAVDPGGFVVRQVRVFDGERTVAAADVLVRDGRIAAVGPALKAPPGLRIIEGRGRTLLPGFIDAHTHAYGTGLRDAIRFGVTTELDMFIDWRALAAAKRQRESFEPVARADLWSAGTLATAPFGHGTQFGMQIPTLTGSDQAQAFVRARVAEGSDYLKIVIEDGSVYRYTVPTLDAATVRALVEAAHAERMLAVAHVAKQADARQALDAGVDGFAHMFVDQVADPQFVRAARQRGVFVVATLSVAASTAGAGEGRALVDDARLKPWLANHQVDTLAEDHQSQFRTAGLLDNALQSVRRLHAAGVPILAGSDAGNPGTAHGASIHGEMALLVRAGLTPLEALRAATELPARTFELADRGRIAPGMRADLVLVEGNPTIDITATRAIVALWKNGAPVDRALLPAEREVPKVALVPEGTLVADFESGAIAARYGQNWSITSDTMMGGRSTATQTWIGPGAGDSSGALRVAGEVRSGSASVWAGTLFQPGAQPFAPVDFSGRKALAFKVRGEPRQLSAMLFSSRGAPATVDFAVTPRWTLVRIPLTRFAEADLARLRGVAVTAGLPVGAFWFEIDDVHIE